MDISKINRKYKYIVYFALDLLLLIFSVILSISIRQETLFHYENIKSVTIFFYLLPFLIIINYWILHIHQIFLRNFSIIVFPKLIFFCFIISCFLAIFIIFFNLYVPRSIIVISFILSSVFLIASRVFLKKIINVLQNQKMNNLVKNIVIFGASQDARKICEYFNSSYNQYKISCFVDDEKNLQNLIINGVKVYSLNSFINKFKDYSFDEIWITNKKKINSKIKLKAKKIRYFSNILDILFSFLNKNFEIGNIVDREKFVLKKENFSFLSNESVLVTGAGGSIGSEIGLQLSNTLCKKIIFVDNSEFSLFKLREKIINNKIGKSEYIYKLGSICDKDFIEQILREHKISIILNCAAYKHVDFVELNKVQAFKNNVFGNNILIQACKKYKIKKYILISTDKAVRPTSFMGLTKRICELLTLNESLKNTKTDYLIIRFGNVVNSNGSLLPILKKQILTNNEVTITDKKMERYFMSIQEASNLVLSCLKLNKNTGIFILDMGQPIKIINLAKKLITSLGYQYTNQNTENYVKIKFIGIKPGEKLKEELSYNHTLKETNIKKVFEAKEDIDIKVLSEFKNKIEQLNLKIVDINYFLSEYKTFLSYNTNEKSTN